MHHSVARPMSIAMLAVAVVTSSSACAGDSSTTAVMSVDEMRQWEEDVITFRNTASGAWPDVDVVFADYADDAVFYDPGSGDYLVEGQKSIILIHRPMAAFWPDISGKAATAFVSADAAAMLVEVANLWPPWVPEPPDPPPVEFLEVYRFENDLVTAFEVWNTIETFELTGLGCFADSGCVAELEAIANQYVAAWSSGNEEKIAALYADDAVFEDTMFGLEGEGSSAIARLADERIGPKANAKLEVLGLAAQINGPSAPTETQPDQGGIIAVAIHYRWTATIDDDEMTGEGLTTFELGTRMKSSFEPEPDGLITREEVFHDAESLITAGMAP